jgi:hypothetical protein
VNGADGEPARDRDRQRYDVRNAITVISARTQLLKKQLERGDSPQQVRAHFAAIDAAVGQLTKAIDGLDPARRENPPT